MRSFNIHILIFLSVTLFPSIGKSNNITALSTHSKLSSYEFTGNYSPLSTIKKASSVNTYVRKGRSVKEDDNFLPDGLPQDKIYYEKPVKFILPSSEQRLHCFCSGLIPSRAPPALN